jgi:hypothetical protein
MATRRNFFKYLGLAGGIAGGGVVAAAAVLPDTERAKCIKEIQSTGYNGKLTLGTEYGELLPTEPNTFRFGSQFVPGTQRHVKVTMTVGPDGELYLNTNDKWRRIVTE